MTITDKSDLAANDPMLLIGEPFGEANYRPGPTSGEVWTRYDEGLKWYGPYPFDTEFPWDAYESMGCSAYKVPDVNRRRWFEGRRQAVEQGAGDSGWRKWEDGRIWVPGEQEPELIASDDKEIGFVAVVRIGEELPRFSYRQK